MKRILIDTDIGVDDALAVLFALKAPELQIEAITTVSGNVHVEQCTRNLRITLGCMNLEESPLISQGEETPLTIAKRHAISVSNGNVFHTAHLINVPCSNKINFSTTNRDSKNFDVSIFWGES